MSKRKPSISPDDFARFDERLQQSLEVARALDARTAIPDAIALEVSDHDVETFIGVLSPKRLQLLKTVRKLQGSIADLAAATHRDRSAVSKDVGKLASVGLVQVIEIPNAGHGIKKIVRPCATRIEIRAALV